MAFSLDRWSGKVAVVTGASSGIGAGIAKKLITEGLLVVGLARRVERVEQLAKELGGQKGKLIPVKCDISQEKDIIHAFNYIREKVGVVHILINNAGVLLATDLVQGDAKMWRSILEVNVLGLSIATREAIRDMRGNNVDGHIIHVNSLAGHNVFPNLPLHMYTGSKYAVTGLAEALRLELITLGSKIKISSVSPGVVETEIFEKGSLPVDYDQIGSLVPEDIANAVIYILSTPPHVQISELTIRPVLERL